MRLVPCDFPVSRKEPVYAKWRDTLREFEELGVGCALIEGVDTEQRTVNQLRNCAKRMFGGRVVVKTRKGKVYLTRSDSDDVLLG